MSYNPYALDAYQTGSIAIPYNGITLYQNPHTSAPSASPLPSAPAVSTSTGVNPIETQYSLYGHIVPASLGRVRIGGEIISGPWVENGRASFIISFGVPFDVADTRTLTEIAFDSEVVWTGTRIGSGVPSSSGFTAEPFTVRFYDGNLSQSADALETEHYGADAIAYRPQILLAFDDLPLANTKFGKIPYVAALFEDSTAGEVNFGTAFETIAESPWVGLTSAQFETSGITDGVTDGGIIIAEDTEFLSLLQKIGRFYPKWSILQTDTLRIVDRGDDITPDIILNRDRLTDQVMLQRAEPNSIPGILELSTIDPDADYTIIPSRAQSPRDPVVVTSSIKTETAYLPVVMDAATRISIVTYARHHEDRARKQISFTMMAYGYQIEPGDFAGIAELGDDFPGGEVFRVVETRHGANYTVEATAESILQCAVSSLTEEPPVPDPGETSTFNPLDVSANIALTNGDLTATATTSSNGGVRSDTPKSSGKLYAEFTLIGTGFGSNTAVGVVTLGQPLNNIAPSNGANAFILGSPGAGTIYYNGSAVPAISVGIFAAGSVVRMAIDLDNQKGWFAMNSGSWNGGGADPATNTGGISISSVFNANDAYAGFCSNASGNGATANFGASSFVYTLPFGFTAWG